MDSVLSSLSHDVAIDRLVNGRQPMTPSARLTAIRLLAAMKKRDTFLLAHQLGSVTITPDVSRLSIKSDGDAPPIRSPIHSLPAEIFLDILFKSIDFDIKLDGRMTIPLKPQLHALARVCAYWWHSIRTDSRFWCMINLEEQSMIPIVLKKNPSGPLVVKYRAIYRNLDSDGFYQVAKDNAHRWKTALFSFLWGNNPKELIGTRAPALKILEMEGDWDWSGEQPLPISAPGVEHLDLSRFYIPHDYPPMTKLSYLKLASSSRVPLTSILLAAPDLKWLGLRNIQISESDQSNVSANSDKILPLLSLRGLEFSHIGDESSKRYLLRQLSAPSCYRLSTYMSFQDVLQNAQSLQRLLGLPMQASNITIEVAYWKDRTEFLVYSPSGVQGLSGWELDTTSTAEVRIEIDDVPPEQEKWTLLIKTLGLRMEEWDVTLRLYRNNPRDFSSDDIAFWEWVTQIEFRAGYVHILSALQLLSKPKIKGDASTWPYPRLTSIRLTYGSREDWDVPEITHTALQDGIRMFLKRRSMRRAVGDTLGHKDGKKVPIRVTMSGDWSVINKLRGTVAEGVVLED